MPKTIHDKLKDLLKEEKDGDKSLLDVISGWQDEAEAKGKVQKANEEIIKERESLKTELKDTKKNLSDKDEEIKRLQANLLTEDDRKKFDEFKKNGMTVDVAAKINKLESTIEAVNKTLVEEKTKREASEKRAQDSYMDSIRAELRKDLTNALTVKKIIGDNVDIALSYIDSKGLVKLEKKEDGTIERKLYVYDDKNKILSAESVDDIAAYIANKHQNLVSSSGKPGTGFDHSSDRSDKPNAPDGRSLQSIQAHAAGMLERTFNK